MVFKKMKKKRNYDTLKQWQLQRKEDMICIYKNCTNNTDNVKKRELRRLKEITFYRFPNPDSNLAKFHKWMILSDIEDAQLARQWNASICSEHFRDGRPTKDSPNPIPHDEQTSSEMSRKKRHLSQRKYAGKTIVIDDEQASASSASATTPAGSAAKTLRKANGELVETLQMQCWSEELCPAQLEAVQRREKEYADLVARLDTLAKQNGGEVVYKGDACLAYQFNTNPPALATFSQSNGVSTASMPTTATVPELPQNMVLTTSKPPGGPAAPGTNTNTYKLVMDPRLGLIVGTMTPTPPPPTTRPRRGRPVTAPSPLTYSPAVATAPAVTSTAPPPVRPAESTAVGGLAAGTAGARTTTAGPATPAIVDLTHDEGRPPPDSREVAFNKLQGKTFPSLVVVARPHLHAKEAANMNDRAVLDTKVKSVLVHTPTKFTEWLIQQGLVRSEQHCSIHPNNKLNLGMYSDVSKFPYSGGYVWISECCPHRFVSVFSGSLFEGAAHPPSVLLKLLYHWSCQTNIQNVVQWVKVDNLYVKGLWTWLRAVCSYALQQHVQPLGGPGKRIEVGVISLGTTSQDGSQRQVKVEVLGILDPELRLIRLRAVEPLADGERNYKRRFSKILEPLRVWVHPDSIIATDLTVDKGTLHFMGFANILQSTATGVPGNQAVMEYLRKIVPRMFQNTLSLLSRQIIQQFLDELVWREWYGQTAAQAFNNMVVHLAEQTRMNVGESLIQRLNKVAANPFKNHAAIYQAHKLDPPSAPAIVGLSGSGGVKRYGRKQRMEVPTKRHHLHMDASPDLVVSSEAMVPLESYYYGTLEGEASAPLAQRVTLNVRCCVCKVPYTNNVALLDHLLAHAHNMGAVAAATQCRYCLAALPGIEELNTHIGEVHPVETRTSSGVFRCVLCEVRFPSVYALGKHLSREHVPQELPYQCGTCGFRSSSHRRAIDHFYTRHDGAATLQCPFCLKSTAVWSSGRIMSTNVTFFLAHLQKHQKKTTAKKCQQCALWFIQKETLKEHQQKAHASLVGRKGVKSWALPNNYALVPKSRIYASPSLMMETVEIEPDRPVINDTHQLTLLLGGGPVRCVECGGQAASPGHFPKRATCDACRYVTDCAGALASHRCHGDMPPLRLDKELHCCCGYTSNDGNRMAKHLALCERKTAYPTAEQAQVATNHQAHSMLDVLGLVRKHDEPMEVEDEMVVEPDIETKADSAIVEETPTAPVDKEDPVVIVDAEPTSASVTESAVEETVAMETEPVVEEPATEPEVSPAAAETTDTTETLDDIIETTDNPVPKLELGDTEVAGTAAE